jgi:hypothetical protein
LRLGVLGRGLGGEARVRSVAVPGLVGGVSGEGGWGDWLFLGVVAGEDAVAVEDVGLVEA